MFTPPEGPAPRGGMFGNANLQQALMAAVAGFMARRSPHVAANMMGMLQQQQQQKLEEQNYQRHRADSFDDWRQRQDYSAAHDTPDYGEFERALIASGVQPGTPGWADAMKRRANNMLDPIVMLPQGPVPRSLIMGNPGAPTQPVGPLTPIDDEGGAGFPAPRPFPY